MTLTQRQKLFCQEYVKNGNATQAAIHAGYSAKTANEQGARLLANVSIQDFIQDLNNTITANNIAEAKEIQEALTKIIRGQILEEVPMCLEGSFYMAKKQVTPKDRLRACELLAKMIGAFNINLNIQETPVIFDDI